MIVELKGHDQNQSDHYDDTETIQSAIDKVTILGGGIVKLREGFFFSGPLLLRSMVHLYIDAGATLSFIYDMDRYPPVWTRWEGVECWAMQPLLFAQNSHHISISGSGTIDGNGSPWWKVLNEARRINRREPLYPIEQRLAALNPSYRDQPSGGGGRELQFLRPPLLQFLHSSNIELRDITLQNSPFWNTHLVYSKNITITNVHFINPHDAPNTDGLNIDSCTDVTVKDCLFDVGDDCLGLKSGAGVDGLRIRKPTEHVMIHGCTMRGGHGGVVIGSETAGGIRDVSIESCTMIGTDRGLRIKTRRGRGGTIEDIKLYNCRMEQIICPVVINCYYGPGGPSPESPVFSLDPQPIDITTPQIRNIQIHNLTALHCKAASAFIVGLPERPVETVHLANSQFYLSLDTSVSKKEAAMYRGLPEPEGRGIRIRNVNGLFLEAVKVEFPKATEETKRTLLTEDNVHNLIVSET
jgi:polygalacturonase